VLKQRQEGMKVWYAHHYCPPHNVIKTLFSSRGIVLVAQRLSRRLFVAVCGGGGTVVIIGSTHTGTQRYSRVVLIIL
jgi:hypothetical protein